MKQLVVMAKDRVGLVADVSEVLSTNKLNVSSISFEAIGGLAVIRLIVERPEVASALLSKEGFKVGSEEVLVVELPDRPGQLAEVSRTLAKKGVNIRNLYILAADGKKTSVVINTEKKSLAKKALKQFLS